MKRLELSRLNNRFSKLVKAYMRDNDLSQKDIAELVGMQRTHLNNLINQSGDRPLTGYYVLKFISRGVFTVKQIYDGKAGDDKEKDFWKTAKEAENLSLLNFIGKVRDQKGVDVEAVLRSLYPDVK